MAIETNGTKPLPQRIDWVCVSPKADADIIITCGNELKLVYPQDLAMPEQFEGLEFEHFYLQPLDGPARLLYTEQVISYCKAQPKWKMSLQTHKTLGID